MSNRELPCPAVLRIFDTPLPYPEAAALQEKLAAQRLRDKIPDTLLLLQHTPVITMGVSSDPRHLLLTPERLAGHGITVLRSSRGGDITYHGPGQLVAYPVLRLRAGERDVRGYIARLEETVIRTAARFDIAAVRRPGMTGVWTPSGKLAAIGVRIRRWVTLHGLSFNIAPDPDGFRFIVPCGLAGEPVTSLRDLLAPMPAPDLTAVRTAFLQAFENVFQRRFTAAATN